MALFKKLTVFLTTGVMVLVSCTPQQALRDPGATDAKSLCPDVKSGGVDTVAYTITFTDSVRREQFVNSFQSFIDHYQFATHLSDTVEGQVVIRIAPPQSQSGMLLSPLQPEWIRESTTHGAGDSVMTGSGEAIKFIDTIAPVAGGTLRLHLQRNSIDGTFLSLLAAPFKAVADSVASPLFTLEMASPRKVVVQLNSRVVDGTGRLISALDLIEAWTGYIRQHPAEGLALFRYVEGVREFIEGKEAVVRGFGATDQYTCYMKLSQPDPHAVTRLSTNRTLGIYSKLGLYFPVKASPQEMVLCANQKTANGMQPLLDTLVINISDDQNAILSFSLKKYDAITLTFTGDVEYARSTLGKQADLQVVSHDRYFISCISRDSTARRYIASRLDAASLLKTTVKADGAPIAQVESDSSDTSTDAAAGEPPAVPAGQQVRILYRSDDEVSRRIAEKLLADLSGSGIRGSLIAAGSTDYERKLVERGYECAVGWVEESIKSDMSEKLRCATMYFSDMLSGAQRIAGYWEIPLFTVDRYILMRKPAGIYHNEIVGLYAASRPIEGGN